MKAYKVVIADDERLMAQELQDMLQELYPEVVISGVCHDGETALALIERIKPDIVFLDIEMPGLSGLQVAAGLLKLHSSPAVVFVTAFDEFALQAFGVNAVDYLLKPLDESDLQRVMDKIHKLWQRPAVQAAEPVLAEGAILRPHKLRRLSVETGDRMEIIDVDQIKLVYAKDRLVFIAMQNGRHYRVKLTLQDFEQRLPPEKFFRCHRNYIVNLDEIKQIATWFKKGYLLILKGEDTMEVPVGRAYTGKLKEYIEI